MADLWHPSLRETLARDAINVQPSPRLLSRKNPNVPATRVQSVRGNYVSSLAQKTANRFSFAPNQTAKRDAVTPLGCKRRQFHWSRAPALILWNVYLTNPAGKQDKKKLRPRQHRKWIPALPHGEEVYAGQQITPRRPARTRRGSPARPCPLRLRGSGTKCGSPTW